MLIKLLPNQLGKYWDIIRYGIVSTDSPITGKSSENIREILRSLVIGTTQCWFIFDEKKVFHGYVLTNIADDGISKLRFLNIYDLYAYKQLTLPLWKDGLDTLVQFAKDNRCHKITAYSDNSQIVASAEKIGFEKKTTFLIKEV